MFLLFSPARLVWCMAVNDSEYEGWILRIASSSSLVTSFFSTNMAIVFPSSLFLILTMRPWVISPLGDTLALSLFFVWISFAASVAAAINFGRARLVILLVLLHNSQDTSITFVLLITTSCCLHVTSACTDVERLAITNSTTFDKLSFTFICDII